MPPAHDDTAVDRLHQRLPQLLRVQAYAEAEQLCREYLDAALAAGAWEDASCCAGAWATPLMLLERYDAMLEALRLAESLAPTTPDRKLNTAECLLMHLDRPAEAMAKLDEAAALLPAGFGHRYRLLNLRGRVHLALGESEAAVACFREVVRPDRLARFRRATSLALFDYDFVAELLEHGLALAECREYLAMLAEIGRRTDSPYLPRVDRLRARLEQP